jgi:hypothetical protein
VPPALVSLVAGFCVSLGLFLLPVTPGSCLTTAAACAAAASVAAAAASSASTALPSAAAAASAAERLRLTKVFRDWCTAGGLEGGVWCVSGEVGEAAAAVAAAPAGLGVAGQGGWGEAGGGAGEAAAGDAAATNFLGFLTGILLRGLRVV